MYIYRIKGNILSNGQFLESNYKIHMKNKVLEVMDANETFLLKSPMAQNGTLKIELKVIEHMGFEINASRK